MSGDAEIVKAEAPETSEDVKVDDKKESLIDALYSQHGGDPRKLDLSHCVMLSKLPTEFLADTYEQFTEFIKTMLSGEHKIDPSSLKQIVRIPKLETTAADQNNALRVLLCFSEKTHKYRMMGRKKDIDSTGMKLEALDELPADTLEISDEDAAALDNGVIEVADEVGEDDEEGEDEHDVDEHHDNNDGEEELCYDNDDDDVKDDDEDGDNNDKSKDDHKDDEKSKDAKNGEEKKKKELPKKKVYEDEDDKAPFEMNWEGAPEFQWRLCDGNRDERKLVIENMYWADLHNVFIYRCMQRATTCEVNFPMRYNGDATKAIHGRLVMHFPGWVPIMDEALKHLIYFRSYDGRRIKIFLPQTPTSLKRKEEFEGKLGRLIKPTPRMMELIVKILPENYTPTLDDACNWFPNQAVIGCELVKDEMDQPCAIVKFETAEEAVAAHAGKSFVVISQTVMKKDKEGVEKEDTKNTNCNVYMRGVEAHFGSFLTFYDQKKKAANDRLSRKRTFPPSSAKRPAGSTIRGPVTKRGRAPSPKRSGGRDAPRGVRDAPRGGGRGGGSSSKRGAPTHRRASPPRSTRGGRAPGSSATSRSAPRPTYRSEPFSNSGQRSGGGAARPDPYAGYGYASFESRYNSGDRSQHIDPFGRPVGSFGGASSSSYASPFQRHEPDRSYQSSSSSSYPDRRRY